MHPRHVLIVPACFSLLAAMTTIAGCSGDETDSTDTGGADLSAQSQTHECTIDNACENSDVLDVCVTKIKISKAEVEVTTTPRSSADEDPKGMDPTVSTSPMGFHDVSSTHINVSWTEGKFRGVVQADKKGQQFVGKLDINGVGFSGKLTCS